MTLSYTELQPLDTFVDRFEYLKLPGEIGVQTFGSDRYLNQRFYRSREWKQTRDQVIIRDNGCDLGVPGFEIFGDLLVHHINPIQVQDLRDFNPDVLNPEYLICVSRRTHNAIHFGDIRQLPQLPVSRTAGDTKLW